jgi:hypothetical protein
MEGRVQCVLLYDVEESEWGGGGGGGSVWLCQGMGDEKRQLRAFSVGKIKHHGTSLDLSAHFLCTSVEAEKFLKIY